MPVINSFADLLRDWSGLLEAVQRYPELHPLMEAERQTLVESYQQLQVLKARQDEHKAVRQEITQQLKQVIETGKVAAMQVRSLARGKIGPKNERLVHFQVAPLRKRSRAGKDGGSTEPPAEPAVSPTGKPST